MLITYRHHILMAVGSTVWLHSCNSADYVPHDDDSGGTDAALPMDASPPPDVSIPDSSPPDAAPLPPRILYVDRSRPEGSTCTYEKPCYSISAAVAQLAAPPIQNVIEVSPGDYMEYLKIAGKRVKIHARGATLLSPVMFPTQSALLAVADGAQVDLVGMQITHLGGQDASKGSGIECWQGMDGDPTILTLREVNLEGSRSLGLRSYACDIHMSRSRIAGNSEGGIFFWRTSFTIENTLVVDNGLRRVGFGMSINGPSDRTELSFCTIARNENVGLSCNDLTQVLQFHSSIVWANRTFDMPWQVQGACMFNFSDIGPFSAGSGEGNITEEPRLNAEYRPAAGSPVVDKADPKATNGVDYWGEPRPQGIHSDMGAGEVLQ